MISLQELIPFPSLCNLKSPNLLYPPKNTPKGERDLHERDNNCRLQVEFLVLSTNFLRLARLLENLPKGLLLLLVYPSSRQGQRMERAFSRTLLLLGTLTVNREKNLYINQWQMEMHAREKWFLTFWKTTIGIPEKGKFLSQN